MKKAGQAIITVTLITIILALGLAEWKADNCFGATPEQNSRDFERYTATAEANPPFNQGTLDSSEYAVFEVVLKNHLSSHGWQISEKTVVEQLSDSTVAFLKKPRAPKDKGMRIDDSMVRDFNQKNKKSYALSEQFIGEKNAYMFRKSEAAGTETIALSRVGFDAGHRLAIVFLRDKYVQRFKAFTQEDFFILLERSDNSWEIRNKITVNLKHS